MLKICCFSSKNVGAQRTNEVPNAPAVPTGRPRRGSIFVSALASDSFNTSPTVDYTAALLDTTYKLVENNHPAMQNENTCANTKKCAANQEIKKHSNDQQDTIQSNGAKKSIMTVSFTAPVSPVKRTLNVLCNSQETGGRSASVASRPTWTLHDVLSSPHDYGSDGTRPTDSNQKLVYTSFPSKPLEQWSQSSTQSFTKITDEDDETTFIFMSGPSRPGSSVHHVHYSQPHPPYPTFFLPRISTDPATVGDVIADDGTVTSTKSFPPRRGSMIVRSGRTTNSITLGNLPEQPSPGVGVEGFIVTPFAQILVSMQKIRSAFIRLTAAQSTHRFGVISSAVPEPGLSDLLMPESSDYKSIANETLEELEWCLKQLENIQTKRPVSDMAFSKFKRLLNKELNSFGEADKSRHEISAYICGTFLEDEKDAQANQEIEQMLERRRSSEQSHCSGGTQDHTLGSSLSKHRTSMLGNDISGTVRVKSGETSNTELQSMKSDTIHSGDRTSKSIEASATSQTATVETEKGEDVNSLECSMPVNGIITPNDQLLDERFTQTLDTWGADIFEIDRLSEGHALTTTAYRIFQKRDLMRIFCIDPATLVRYLLKVESSYHSDVPYHNALHAADVTQTSHYLLQAEPLEDVFSDLEILAVIFASAVHDVDHPGLTNQYLINTGKQYVEFVH
ncbi:Phosphodiesterase [Paragonimus heterotremus]|uniref:Phosphodiesterase n=1 Tax=Paragonimus heterotremus TaxID=100268 RepID=A0A8J4WL16_9TREM|nr:Phosphodiesterase [Paragonimus heterotremus]